MIDSKKIAVCFLCLLLTIKVSGQANSVLASGSWAKFSVTADGVYKINADALRKAGINPDQIDPRNIQLFAGTNSMLPQANSKARIKDLVEIPLFVSGESDGKFNGEDFVLFFAQGPDQYSFNMQRQMFSYQNNLFTDKNFYFLRVATSPGKRMATIANQAGSFPVIREFDDFSYYETEKFNLLKSGRQWFGEQFDTNTEATIRFDIPGIVENSTIKFASHMMAQSISSSSFNIFFNNTAILTQNIAAIPNTPYGIIGKFKIDTIGLNSTTVKASTQSTQDIKYQFTRGTTPGISVGYLDFLLFSYKRKLALYGAQTGFTASQSVANSTSTFELSDANTKTLIWDVTDPLNAGKQETTLAGNKINFSTPTSSLKKFIAFNPDQLALPIFEGAVANQNLRGLTPTSLIIITHPSFKKEADRLAAHRQSYSSISASVVTTEQIFNEYASGKPDFTAIRDFIRDQFKKPGSTLKNVLLFGRGSYDYRDRVFGNTNYVPIYESTNSLSPLETYSSDDFFALLEDHEGEWKESPAENATLDIGIGRLPIKKIEEAKAIVDKLIQYDIDAKGVGAWRKNILFVADDGNSNLHESQANQLANTIDQTNLDFEARRLFIGSYKQVTNPTGQISPDATRALNNAIRQGQSIINYTGHGSEKVWMQEQILNETTVLESTNGPRYPFFVTATCEFGRNDDPFITSTAERLLTNPKGGGIGLVTTARPVNSFTNFNLNNAFYAALFVKENNQFRDIGSVFKATKNNSVSGTANRNFSLLGDPSMKLQWGENNVAITTVTTSNNNTDLQPLAQVTVVGEILNNGIKKTNFSGSINVMLLDKAQELTTIADNEEFANPSSPAFLYSERSNKLFDGNASVVNGDFQISFRIPKNVSVDPDKAKFSFYANATNGEDAIGYSTTYKVGGPVTLPLIDTTPPQIKLFIGDTTFIGGGIAALNTKLVAQLADASGINISSLNQQHSIVATLDGKQSFILNNYYEAAKNNFAKGEVVFPLDTLKKGRHTLLLMASDTYNNTSQATVDFVVSDGTGISIEQFTNYPNPVEADGTTFWFTHNRPGEDLQATLVIYNLAGQVVVSQDYTINESQYLVTLPKWKIDNADGIKPGPGLYLARLFVRSLLDGSNNERNAKIILPN